MNMDVIAQQTYKKEFSSDDSNTKLEHVSRRNWMYETEPKKLGKERRRYAITLHGKMAEKDTAFRQQIAQYNDMSSEGLGGFIVGYLSSHEKIIENRVFELHCDGLKVIIEPKTSDVAERFEPSDKLANYVVAETKERAEVLSAFLEKISSEEGVVESNQQNVAEYSTDAAKILIKRTVSGLIATIGEGYSELGLDATIYITKNREFISAVCDALLVDALPINRYESAEFLELLFKELLPVARSGKFGGEWGALIVDKGELALDIRSNITNKADTSAIKAEVIKL